MPRSRDGAGADHGAGHIAERGQLSVIGIAP